MIDREKVIKGLEWVIDLFSNYERHAMGDEEMQSLNDAIMLLKEQELLQDNDLISRAAAIKAVHEEFDECLVWDESGEATANAVENVLRWIQSVDAVSVVRCHDCKYYNTTCCSPGFGWCERSGHNHGTTDNWFCADGRDRYD